MERRAPRLPARKHPDAFVVAQHAGDHRDFLQVRRQESLPVFVRRIWKASSETSRSGRSAGKPCQLRSRHAGMVFYVKARTVVIRKDPGER